VTKDEFKKYWDMITADKTFTIEVAEDKIYKGFAQQPDDIQTCL
jgi:hypothetical protein